MSNYINRTENNLKFGTNGIDRLKVEYGGNIGINTNFPEYELDVSGTIKNKDLISNIIYFEEGLGVTENVSDFNDNYWDSVIDNNIYYLNNVGIGVTNPSAKLEVGGNIYPSTTETYDLGTTTQRWRDLYLSGSSINLGGLDMSYDGSDLNISGGLNTTSNTDFNIFSINSGTQIVKMACGKYDFGSGSGSTTNVRTITFGTTFSDSTKVRVFVTPSTEPGRTYNDTFSCSVKLITTTQFDVHVYRVDQSGSWGQGLDIHWWAFETS
jgi:hypothetical protein